MHLTYHVIIVTIVLSLISLVSTRACFSLVQSEENGVTIVDQLFREFVFEHYLASN